MNVLYLIPPSEGKNLGGIQGKEKLSYTFKKPLSLAKLASQKDLKCTKKRYEEAIHLNTHIENSEVLPAIERYTGVMYKAFGYGDFSQSERKYFDNHVGILSAMYGLVFPRDIIGNYKLPIETKGLYNFWGDTITEVLHNGSWDVIVDLLPGTYKKMIDWDSLDTDVLQIDFFHYKNNELKKMTHGVKKVKGEYLHDLCKKQYSDIKGFGKNIEQIGERHYQLREIIST